MTASPDRHNVSDRMIERLPMLPYLRENANEYGVVKLRLIDIRDAVGLPDEDAVKARLSSLFRLGYITAQPDTTYPVLTDLGAAAPETKEDPAELPRVEVPKNVPKAVETAKTERTTAERREAAKSATLPRTGLQTRPAEHQNEHTVALVNKTSGTTQHVALIASIEIGIEKGRTHTAGRPNGVPFGEIIRELTPEYLALKTGRSESACRTAMAEVVKAGYFVRTDNGKGGRGKKNGAKYRATMPVY